MALGLKLNSCLYVPRTIEDSPPTAKMLSDAKLSPTGYYSDRKVHMPTTPTPSSSGLLLPNHSPISSKKICAICLSTMKPGHGHAIFTAECSHSFHFHCITSNVKHGKQSCPICRAKWKEVPFQGQAAEKSHERQRSNNVSMPLVRRSPSLRGAGQRVASFTHVDEPAIFDDDDEVASHQIAVDLNDSSGRDTHDDHIAGAVDVQTYPEVPAVTKSKPHNNFSILIHLKAPVATAQQQTSEVDIAGLSSTSQNSRAPVDLVTVLDVSGSMAGTKLALLKRAMGFVIQNLGPSDRLSVIAFSSTARRLFPLRRMTNIGKHEALQAVNSLSSNGGTNIAEGLRKGAKIMTECKCKNPVSSIILLSDGQDTYGNTSPRDSGSDHQSLLPVSMHCDSPSGLRIPIHTFGFGADHDADAMHSISQTSGGTFSFIESEDVMQDAFAQCIGGLLSVVVQELKLEVECINPVLQLTSIKSGSYKTNLASDKRKCSIEIGDLYAEEERDFLVTTDIPVGKSCNEMSLIKVRYTYRHPVSKDVIALESASNVVIQRPVVTGPQVVSMEVDRQRNRLRSAEAMAEAKAAAERGDLTSAASILENCRKQLQGTVSSQAGDRLCVSLDAELQQMQERMVSRRVYETSGRAYVLSGLSSHLWQRATARGDSTDGSSLVHAYQTPSMVDMVTLSQTMIFSSPLSSRPRIKPTLSFPAPTKPR